MSLKRRLFVVTLALCGPLVLAAPVNKPVTLEDVIRKVQEQQKKTRTLQAEFRQEKELSLLATPEVSKGMFYFSKPNRVLWEYQSPKRVQMLISGGTLTTWFPDLKRAERLDVKRFEERIFKYLGASGAIDELARYFDFTFVDNAASPHFQLRLQPKTKVVAKRVKGIQIWIDKKTYLTSKFEYVEGDGDVTRYEFLNVRFNEPMPASRFTLALPADVKIEQMKLQ